ncbi:MAG: hypothetical protein JRC90_05820 [Deltaproteobacteria bacterium]|nr:hypothetical protein [Deltaproteobacteria bacterium]
MPNDDKTSLNLLLLENTFNDIRYTKQQQWYLLYLAIIAITGITSLAFAIKFSHFCHCFKYFLILCDILISLMGGGFIIRYAFSLEKYRKEKKRLVKELGSVLDDKGKIDTITFTLCFCLIIFLSLITSMWAILIKCPCQIG